MHADPVPEILDLAREQGFALAGIAAAAPAERPDAYRAWIAAGKHGEMHYLANNLDARLNPDLLLPGAKSILAVADPYHPGSEVGNADAAPRGRVAKYAHGADYHKVLKKRLHQLADALAAAHPEHTFRTTVDTAPALEREHAARAGLGWTGKNTLLIHPRHGSFFLLGLIVTTLELKGLRGKGAEGLSEKTESKTTPRFPSAPPPLSPLAPVVSDHCANCTRCIDACPTDAIDPAGYTLDATKCVSYLTLEHRSPIDAELHEGLGDWLGGCDVCQDVCPYNAVAARQDLPLPVHPRYAPRAEVADGLRLIDVIRWTDDDRAAAFRGSALKRMKLDMVRRNALIAAGNALAQRGDTELEAAVRSCVDDDAELVAVTARQVVAGLNRREP